MAPTGRYGSANNTHATSLEGKLVLVADDDDDNAELVVGILALEEAEVRKATSGHEAADILASWRPDVLVIGPSAAVTSRPGGPLERPTVPAPQPTGQRACIQEEVTANLKNDPRHEDD